MGFLFRLFHGGFDKDGYNKAGYNRDGFNRDGYDKYGYNLDGYNKTGYDKEGYNRSGYNRQGYNRQGYNRHGYKQHEYNRDGYTKDGYDRKGYDRDGFTKDGFSANGKFKKISKYTLLGKPYYNFIHQNRDRFLKPPHMEIHLFGNMTFVYQGIPYEFSGNYGHPTLIVDFHGLSLDDAFEIINEILNSASDEIGRIMVIHGFHRGHAIKDMIQKNISHVKIKKKTYDKRNPGRTFLYLKLN